MKIDFNTKQSKPAFGVKVSPNLISIMKNSINVGENRLKRTYLFNSQIEAFNNSFGYKNYTVDLVRKYVGWGTEYMLVAVKDGSSIKDGTVIAKANSFRIILNKFLNMNKSEFCKKIHK